MTYNRLQLLCGSDLGCGWNRDEVRTGAQGVGGTYFSAAKLEESAIVFLPSPSVASEAENNAAFSVRILRKMCHFFPVFFFSPAHLDKNMLCLNRKIFLKR